MSSTYCGARMRATVIVVVALVATFVSPVFAEEFQWQACPPVGTRGEDFYEFEPGIRDAWDPKLFEAPRLSVEEALRLASKQIDNLKPARVARDWALSSVVLHHMEEKRWVYIFTFQARLEGLPKRGERIEVYCDVLVRLDGSIPPTVHHARGAP